MERERVIAVSCTAIVTLGVLVAWLIWLCVGSLQPLLHDLVAELRAIRKIVEKET